MTPPIMETSPATHESHEWEKLSSQHEKTLDEHLRLWLSVVDDEAVDSSLRQLALGCMDRTKEMISNFRQSSTSYVAGRRTSRDGMQIRPNDVKDRPEPTSSVLSDQTEKLSLRPTKKRRMEDDAQNTVAPPLPKFVQDHSGLFSIDSNPTPVEQLMSQAIGNGGRGPAKRAKKLQTAAKTPPLGSTTSAQDQTQPPSDGHLSSGSVSAVPVDAANQADDDAFLAKVNRRYQEKEEKRKQKSNKKRKRESDNSVGSSAGDGQFAAKKRKKKKHKPEGAGDPQTNDQAPDAKTANRMRSTPASKDKGKRHKKG